MSKKQQDMDATFKETLAKERLIDVVNRNKEVNSGQVEAKSKQKQSQLQQEKDWVNSMVEVQRHEDKWHRNKRAEITSELRQTYYEQGTNKRDQLNYSLKM